MAEPRLTQLEAIPYNTSAEQYADIPPDGNLDAIKFAITGSIDLAAGGGTSGTVITTPLSPFGAISKLEVTRNPDNEYASLAGGAIPPYLWHLIQFLLEGKVPERTALADGDTATGKTVYGSGIIPFSFFKALDTLLPVAGLKTSSFRLGVTWPTSDALLRDALLSGSNRTLTNNATDPLRVEVTAIDYAGAMGAALPGRIAEVSWRWDRHVMDRTGLNTQTLPVKAGEAMPFAMSLMHDNSVRANLIGGTAARVNFRYGTGLNLVNNRKPDQVQRQNGEDMQIQTADWITGLYFFNELERLKGMAKRASIFDLPIVSEAGSAPQVDWNTGSTAPTSTAYVDTLCMIVKFTPLGLAKRAKYQENKAKALAA